MRLISRDGIVSVAAGVAIALAASACAGVNHDAPNPSKDIQYQWVRIETPPSFQTLMFGCFGTTGLYLDQGDGNLSQIPSDPMCPIANIFNPIYQQRYHYKLVQRTNGQGAGTS